jgi:hypothetical protein
MKAVLITLSASAVVLLLGGCPDHLPGGPGPAHSDMHWTAPHSKHTSHEGVVHPSADSASGSDAHRSVGEIAWFQGTIDEAFTRRGCSEVHPRRTLFRF